MNFSDFLLLVSTNATVATAVTGTIGATKSALLPHEFFVVLNVSKISGMLSLCVWLFAQLPQVLENHLNQSVDGVSPGFLACWVGGDVTNLVGCLLTHALPFQTCLAAYYCFIDVILGVQFWYYTRVYPRQTVHHNMLQSPNMMRPVKSTGSVKGMLQSRLNRFEASPKNRHRRGHGNQRLQSSERRPRRARRSFLHLVLSGSVISSHFGKAGAFPVDNRLLNQGARIHGWAHGVTTKARHFLSHLWSHVATLHYSAALVGTCSGWLSTGLYVSSRLPQIWHNYHAQSTTGVSPFLFLFAMTGNVLYTVSLTSDLYLLAHYDEYLGNADFRSVLAAQLPFLVGSSGTVLFDAVLLFQFWLYRTENGTAPGLVATNLSPPAFSGTISLPPDSLSSGVHFTKPDWYTNTFLGTGPGTGTSMGTSMDPEIGPGLAPAMNDIPDFPYHDYGPRAAPNERSLLLHDPYVISPPPHYVVSSGVSSVGPQPAAHRRGISGTFSAFTKSFSHSPVFRSPSVSSPGVFGPPNASLPGTALLPSIVGTYSSISKKMTHDSKIPFLPIDFLHDDLLHRRNSLATDHRYMSSRGI